MYFVFDGKGTTPPPPPPPHSPVYMKATLSSSLNLCFKKLCQLSIYTTSSLYQASIQNPEYKRSKQNNRYFFRYRRLQRKPKTAKRLSAYTEGGIAKKRSNLTPVTTKRCTNSSVRISPRINVHPIFRNYRWVTLTIWRLRLRLQL